MHYQLLLGSYTRANSKGIYSIQLDTEKHSLVQLTPIINEENPTYLDMYQNKYLYTVSKLDNEGGIAAYEKINDQEYRLINRILEPTAPLCYVSTDEKRHLVYGANYHTGEIFVYQIQADGSLKLADKVAHNGNGPHENQKSAHVHYTNLIPLDKRLAVCDLGTDELYTYDIDNSGKLTELARFKATHGSGPRHLVFHPKKSIAYLVGELDSTVTVLDYDINTGKFTKLATHSSIDSEVTQRNGASAIRISIDGQYLYVSNRADDSITVFSIDEDGKDISLIQWISTEGSGPRDFALSPDEQFVVVANQNAGTLTLYRRDSTNGLLYLIQKNISAPECVCVYFIK